LLKKNTQVATCNCKRIAGAFCIFCMGAVLAHDISLPSTALCEGAIKVRDLGPPADCDGGSPHSPGVRITTLASSTGTVTMTHAVFISQIIANDEGEPEPLDRRFASTTFTDPRAIMTADGQRTPVFTVGNRVVRQIR
jgi:hypothetical protein